jgi:hypothetical protein
MNDEHTDPPAEDRQDPPTEPPELPRSEEELRDVVQEIITEGQEKPSGEDRGDREIVREFVGDEDTDPPKEIDQDPLAELRGLLPRSDAELRNIVREIVNEVLQDVEASRRAAAEPVRILAGPTLWLARIRLTPKQMAAAVAVVTVLVVAPLTWVYWPRTVDIPDGAVGLWTTLTPNYADRAFRLTRNTLTFHVSPQDSTFHPIVRVESSSEDGDNATRYTVFYTHYRDVYEFSFLYSEVPDTTIKFVNQRQMIWRKGTL